MRPSPLLWEPAARWAPTLVVIALAQAGVGLDRPWDGTDWALALVGCGLGIPLLARRALPLAVALALAGTLIAQAHWVGLSFATFVAVLVATYSLGRHAPRNLEVGVGVIALFTAIVVAGALAEDPDSSEALVIPLLYLGTASAVGRVTRRLVQQTAELRRLNDDLARERDTKARLAVAEERLRISGDLHDVVAHALTVTVIQAENLEESLPESLGEDRRSARAIAESGRRGLDDLRSMVRLLREESDATTGRGLGEIHTLAEVMRPAGLDVRVNQDGDVTDVPSVIGEQLARIVQEALTNVVKHSSADRVDVQVEVTQETVRVTVTDPGPRIGRDVPRDGMGLQGMERRIGPHRGTVSAGPDGEGWRVVAVVPRGAANVGRGDE